MGTNIVFVKLYYIFYLLQLVANSSGLIHVGRDIKVAWN
jgi:hypothetical protein